MIHSGDVLQALAGSRPAFGNDSEAERIANLLASLVPVGEVHWLEVGAGDGRHLEWLLSKLRGGRQFSTTAIEPARERPPVMIDGILNWLRIRVEDYDSTSRFDWINVRHSAYYFEDVMQRLEALTCLLSKGGLLSITHWSKDCTLFQLHREICGSIAEALCPTFEEIVDYLSAINYLEVVDQSRFSSELRQMEAVDPPVASALYMLARRDRPVNIVTADEQVALVSSFFAGRARALHRINGLLVLRRR